MLALAHEQALRRVSTKILQVPDDSNCQGAIGHPTVETQRGTFVGIGDASPANVSRQLLTVTIRLAETRAKARALRDAVNVGLAALEELGEDPGPDPDSTTTATYSRCRTYSPGLSSEPRFATENPATDAQWRASERFGGTVPANLSKSQASAIIAQLQRNRSALEGSEGAADIPGG